MKKEEMFMKKFLKVVAGILGIIVVLGIVYFTVDIIE